MNVHFDLAEMERQIRANREELHQKARATTADPQVLAYIDMQHDLGELSIASILWTGRQLNAGADPDMMIETLGKAIAMSMWSFAETMFNNSAEGLEALAQSCAVALHDHRTRAAGGTVEGSISSGPLAFKPMPGGHA